MPASTQLHRHGYSRYTKEARAGRMLTFDVVGPAGHRGRHHASEPHRSAGGDLGVPRPRPLVLGAVHLLVHLLGARELGCALEDLGRTLVRQLR